MRLTLNSGLDQRNWECPRVSQLAPPQIVSTGQRATLGHGAGARKIVGVPDRWINWWVSRIAVTIDGCPSCCSQPILAQIVGVPDRGTGRKLPIGQVGDCRDCGCPGSPREDGARAVSENRSPACRMAVDGAPENADLGQFALLTIRADAGFCGQVISDQIVGVPDRSGSRADCCVRSMRIGGARERPGSDPGSRIFVC